MIVSCHLVPVGGKSELLQPLVVAQGLSIPAYVLFDADGDDVNPNRRAKHEKDNKALLSRLGGNMAEPFPAATQSEATYTVWPANLGETLKADVGQVRWDQLHNLASARFGHPAGFGKNAMHIGTKMALAKEAGDDFPSLDELCERIITFG